MAAVQLADREQVQRRRQHPEPGRERHRVHVQREAVRRRAPDQPRRELEEQRLAQLEQPALVGGQRRHVRHRQANEQRRHGDDEAGDRAGDADVEQHLLARDLLADADERAHRPGQQERHRNEKRQGRIDVIIAAGEIVAELVAAEDGEDRSAVPEAPEQERRERHR